MELAKIWYETDIRSVLPSVNVPALLLDQQITPSDEEETQYVASLMPLAEVKPLPRDARIVDVVSIVVDEIRGFVGVEPPMPELDTVLATVLFTDIVGSTQMQSALGSHAWKELSNATMPLFVRRSNDGTAWRSTRRATASTPPSTVLRAPSDARRTLCGSSGSWGSRSEQVCTPGSARSSTAMHGPDISIGHGSRRPPALRRCASRRRSRISSRALVSRSGTSACIN